MALGEAETTTRQRRQLADAAIAHATNGEWEEAVTANRQLLELGTDIDACNRLGKALAELGRHGEALEAYEQALERDGTNRIAQRNIERLRVLMTANRPAANGKGRPEKAPATLFIEEMGKTGRARLINLAAAALAPLSPGDAVTLDTDGDDLAAHVGSTHIGSVEPRIAARLLKLMATGNRYDAAITTVHEAGGEVVVIIREVFTHPANFGKVSFPTQGQATSGVRPYLKGTPLRYDGDDDEIEEADEDSEEVEELDTTLPEYSSEPELEEDLVEEP